MDKLLIGVMLMILIFMRLLITSHQLDEFCYVGNADCSGNDESSINGETAEYCIESCRLSPTCVAVNYVPIMEACYLKTACDDVHFTDHVLLYAKVQEAVCPTDFCFLGRMDCSGNDIQNLHRHSIQSCLATCRTLEDCVAVAYVENINRCYLKHSCAATSEDADVALYVLATESVCPGDFCYFGTIDCMSNDIMPAEEYISSDQCLRSCRSIPGCVAVLHQTVQNVCYLKTACEEFVYDQNVRLNVLSSEPVCPLPFVTQTTTEDDVITTTRVTTDVAYTTINDVTTDNRMSSMARASTIDALTTTSHRSSMDSGTTLSKESTANAATTSPRMSTLSGASTLLEESTFNVVPTTPRMTTVDSASILSEESTTNTVTTTPRMNILASEIILPHESTSDGAASTHRISTLDSASTVSDESAGNGFTTTRRIRPLDSASTFPEESTSNGVILSTLDGILMLSENHFNEISTRERSVYRENIVNDVTEANERRDNAITYTYSEITYEHEVVYEPVEAPQARPIGFVSWILVGVYISVIIIVDTKLLLTQTFNGILNIRSGLNAFIRFCGR